MFYCFVEDAMFLIYRMLTLQPFFTNGTTVGSFQNLTVYTRVITRQHFLLTENNQNAEFALDHFNELR